MKFSTKFIIGVLAVVTLTIVIGVFSWVNLTDAHDSIIEIGHVKLPSVQSLRTIEESLTSIDGGENNLLYPKISQADRQKQYERITKAQEQAKEAWINFSKLPQTELESKLCQKFQLIWIKLSKGNENFIRLSKAYDRDQDPDHLDAMIHQAIVVNSAIFKEANQLLQQIVDINLEDSAKAVVTTNSEFTQSKIVISIIISIVSLIGVSFGIIRSIPIIKLTRSIVYNKMLKISKRITGQKQNAIYEESQATNIINESNVKISNIIKLTKEIAFQTNLLALNAAVEANRVSENDEDFSAVTEEIRNLAQQSASAADETSQLIQDTIDKITDDNELNEEFHESFYRISSSASKVAALIEKISSVSQQQNRDIKYTNSSIDLLNQAKQRFAGDAEESTNAVEDLFHQAKMLRYTTDELTSLITDETR